MAAITRRMAINNAHTILKNYRKKINDANQYKEYLPLVGQQIIERYKNNSDNYKTLLDEATDSKSFFIGMGDETLISYNNICDRLNNIFDLNVSESKKINGFIDEQFVVRSAEEVITGIRTVEIGRKVEYKLGTADKLQEDMKLFDRYYIEWEVEDIDNNFSKEHNTVEAAAENIIDFFDNSFSNRYDRTFYAVKEGRYIIKAKIHDLKIGNVIDTIEFEQVVETGDETIMSMDLQQKILRALQLIDWKVDLDFAALTEALFKATGVIIAIAAIATIAPELAAAIVAIMTIGMGIDAAINIIKGIVQLSEALQLIDKARSERALQVGGEKIKEGILNIGVGIIEVLLKKLTMKNLANARVQVLKNVTPKTAALPQTALSGSADTLGIAAKSTATVPAVTSSTNEVTVILNKSAVQAMENVAQMSVLQSEKVALQEMISTEKLPGIDSLLQGENERNQLIQKTIKNETSYTIPRDNPIVKQIEQETASEVLRELASKNNIKKQMASKIKEVGWTEEIFAEKVVKPISTLTDEELQKIKKVNDVISNPTNDTWMSKVISEDAYKEYISNGKRSDTVFGCVTKAADVAEYKTYEDFYEQLGLHYEGTPYKSADKMYIIRYISPNTEKNVCRNFGGTTVDEKKRIMNLYGLDDEHAFVQKDPFVGNGATKTPSNEYGSIEFNAFKPCKIEDGAAIYELCRTAENPKLVAVRHKNQWYTLGEKK